jgi:hypothetical protein
MSVYIPLVLEELREISLYLTFVCLYPTYVLSDTNLVTQKLRVLCTNNLSEENMPDFTLCL